MGDLAPRWEWVMAQWFSPCLVAQKSQVQTHWLVSEPGEKSTCCVLCRWAWLGGLINANSLSVGSAVVFQNFVQKMEIFLVGLEKKRRKKEKEREILLVGVISQGDLLLTCCKPPSSSWGGFAREGFSKSLSSRVFTRCSKTLCKQARRFVQFKKVTILLLLLLLAFS